MQELKKGKNTPRLRGSVKSTYDQWIFIVYCIKTKFIT